MDENTQEAGAGNQESQGQSEDALYVTDVPREKPGRALLHVGIGALVFAGITALYLWNANRTHVAQTLVFEARPLVELADVVSLRTAVDRYQQALDTKGGFEKAVAGMAEAYTLLWVDHGIDAYQAKAKEFIAESADDGIERGERFGAEALVAYHEGRFDDALRITGEVLDKGGVSERLNWVLGLAQRAQGELAKGRANLLKAQDSKSSAPHYAVTLAEAFDEDGNRYNAAHFWAVANTVNSNYVPAAAGNIIGRARSGGEYNVLNDELARLSALPAEDLGTRDQAYIEMARSEVLFQQAKTGEAVAAANKAIEIDGATAPRLFTRGVALIADGKLDDGFKDLVAAREKVPASTRYFFETARLYFENARYDQALEVLKDADRSAEHINEPEYHTLMGDILRDKGESEKAVAAYEKALNINPEFPEALLGLGVTGWRKKDYDGSLKWFEKAVAARSQFPEVYIAIGMMWFEQKAADQANIQLEEAERQLNKRGANRLRMARFYGDVLKCLTENRASSTYVNQWVAKEKEFRESAP